MASQPQKRTIIDIGGRKSPYTVGIEAEITISERPRDKDIQEKLRLGMTPELLKQVNKRRSNIKEIIFDDMANSILRDDSYDIALAVEVLEHVADDRQFLFNVTRILKPGGLFIMTTPNGRVLSNIMNPDHQRHYLGNYLSEILKHHFSNVSIHYISNHNIVEIVALKSALRNWYAAPLIWLCRMMRFIEVGVLNADSLEHRASTIVAICIKN